MVTNPLKSLGQNFLCDATVVDNLIAASSPQPNDIYLEIGPGQGAVTTKLASRVREVIAVELDARLIPHLEKLARRLNNVSLIQTDILKFLRGFRYYDTYHGNQPNKIVGSIPYQITSPLLHALADSSLKTKLDNVVLLIQKEVAQKITARPPNAAYLSNFVQAFFEVRSLRNVSRESFFPVPEVDGAVVVLRPKPAGLNPTRRVKPETWSAFLHQGFKFPRKMLKRVFDEKMLQAVDIGPGQRPQEVGLERWVNLYKLYEK